MTAARTALSSALALVLACVAPAHAQAPAPAKADPMANFHAGTLIADYGKIATVADTDVALAPDTVMRVAFDTATGAPDKLNRTLESAARFLNMHAEAGVPADHQHLAVVVHGSAVFDVARNDAYARKYPDSKNPNAALVAALRAHGVRIIVCGQSAAAHGVSKSDLLAGVELALSAMTAHALLQQQGYTINPF